MSEKILALKNPGSKIEFRLLLSDRSSMQNIFAVALEIGAPGWIAIVISSLGFIVMFGISSAKGDYQGLAKTTLENDEIMRRIKRGDRSK